MDGLTLNLHAIACATTAVARPQVASWTLSGTCGTFRPPVEAYGSQPLPAPAEGEKVRCCRQGRTAVLTSLAPPLRVSLQSRTHSHP